jgi:carboxypeptidase T
VSQHDTVVVATHRRSWLLLPGAAVVVASAIVSVAVRRAPPDVTRVAIRVSCDDAAACAFARALALDVWSEDAGPQLPVDLVVADRTLPLLDRAGVDWQVLVPDIDAVARDEAARLRGPAPADFFAEYRDFEAIGAHLHELAALAPDRAQLHGIGASIDGRPLWALRIGNGSLPMLVNGTQHAREWIATMVTTCIADRLVRDYDRDPRLRAFVDSTTLWVVPVVNPDGYQYSWSTDRYWRKNRRGGYGVDLNRNFGVAFGGPGSSGNKRAENYRGEYAFSEPESAALRDLAKRERIALHVDFHAFGQLVLYPWGYTSEPTKDRDRFAAVGDRIASALFAEHETRYRLMQSIELYPAAGDISDWMYGELAALSYAIELRPSGFGRGRTGFVLPPEAIRPTCDEGLAAVLALRATN